MFCLPHDARRIPQLAILYDFERQWQGQFAISHRFTDLATIRELSVIVLLTSVGFGFFSLGGQIRYSRQISFAPSKVVFGIFGISHTKRSYD